MNRSPVLFTCLVAALVAVIAWHLYSNAGRPDWLSTDIVIDDQRRDQLTKRFEHSWQRPPNPQETAELIDGFLREEIAFREGLSRGLGSDDVPLRRRVRELLENSARLAAEAQEPTKADLQQFLTDNPDLFLIDELVSFHQVTFELDETSIGADAQARFLIGELHDGEIPEDLAGMGDPSPIPLQFENATTAEIAGLFGGDFVAGLERLQAGRWGGPLRSQVGLHVVHLDSRSMGRTLELEEIEEKVRSAYLQHAGDRAVEQLYKELSKKYQLRR